MRIISGSLRGREIVIPKNSRIRPATSFVRELVVNLFTPERLAAGAFLDLCAGSGLVGFEALSRGAPYCIFVETDARTAGDLGVHARQFGVADQVQVLSIDARRCFKRVATALPAELALSCIFLDPPYIAGMARDLIERVGRVVANPVEGTELRFTSDPLIMLRTPDPLPDSVRGLRHVETRSAGNAKLWLYTP